MEEVQPRQFPVIRPRPENVAKRTLCVVVDHPVSARQALISDWSNWMRSEGLARRTIDDRAGTLHQFASAGLDIVQATADDLVLLLAHDGWKPATRATYYRTLRAWFLWLVRRGLRADNPTDWMKAPRVPRRTPRPCTNAELARLLAVCNRRRTRGMVLLAAYEGLRAHEIAKHRGEFLRGGWLRVVGKGGVEDEIPAHPLVLAIAEHFPRRGYWFPSYSRPDEPIKAQSVSQALGDAFGRAGVQATGHQLRHWFGTNVLEGAGGNVRTAQEALRHAALSSTQIYTKVENEAMKAAVHALPVPIIAA